MTFRFVCVCVVFSSDDLFLLYFFFAELFFVCLVVFK